MLDQPNQLIDTLSFYYLRKFIIVAALSCIFVMQGAIGPHSHVRLFQPSLAAE